MTNSHFRITEFAGCVRLSVTIRKAKQRKVTRTTKPIKSRSATQPSSKEVIQLSLPGLD